jgi:hypothetical protein
MSKEFTTLEAPRLDHHGHKYVRQINHVLNTEDFTKTPGYSWLLIAANPQLSAADLQLALRSVGKQHNRSESWIRRHRWMFSDPKKIQARGPKRNADGLDDRAFRFMADNVNLSSNQLAGLLRKNGIPRSREWVRQNRCKTGG